jgi:Protein of unknown function (DUF2851)
MPSDATSSDPTASDSTLNEPLLSDPPLSAPTLNGPAPSDPTPSDPALSDPAPSVAKLNDSTLSDATHTDPMLGDQLRSAQAPGDPTKGDLARSEALRAGSHRNARRHDPGRRSALCSESALADAWQERRYADEWLIDSTNRRLRVVFAGRRWGGPGPDFRGAVLALANGSLVRGDIEIHRRARDWIEHGHALDPAYANVVLHVVRVLDGPSVDAHQQPIPTVALVPERGTPALARPTLAPCVRDPSEVLRVVSAAGRARFHARAARFEADLSMAEPDQVVWRGLAEALGFTRNTEAFGRLAEAVPWSEATRVVAERGPVGLAGLLLGMAGLINHAALPEAHAWRVLQRRLRLRVALDSKHWDRRALRAANAPDERCRGLAELAARWTDARLGVGRGARLAAHSADPLDGDARLVGPALLDVDARGVGATGDVQGSVGVHQSTLRPADARHAPDASPLARPCEPHAACLGLEAHRPGEAHHVADCAARPQHPAQCSPGPTQCAGGTSGAPCGEAVQAGMRLLIRIEPGARTERSGVATGLHADTLSVGAPGGLSDLENARSTESLPAEAAHGALPAHKRRTALSFVAGAAVAAPRSAAPRRADSGPAERDSPEYRPAGPRLDPTRDVRCASPGYGDGRWAGLAEQTLDAVRHAATMRRPRLWPFVWASPWIGRGRAQVIAINVLLPFAFASGVVEAADVFERLAGEPTNRVVRYMAGVLAVPGVRFRGALRQQGLLQLFTDTCAERRCERCPARGMDVWTLPQETWP